MSIRETQSIINKISQNRTPGPDSFTYDITKYFRQKVYLLLYHLQKLDKGRKLFNLS